MILPVEDPTADTQGKQLYGTYCASCHGADALGTGLGPDLLEEVAEESDTELREVIQEGDDDMPPIPLTDEQANEVIAYLLALSESRGYDMSERCEEDH